ncbi:MAG: hypothetical protein HY841_12650 [Bacteroidetes bacterium]|nr:hypothetical protein [Bacteroidota bacterium]
MRVFVWQNVFYFYFCFVRADSKSILSPARTASGGALAAIAHGHQQTPTDTYGL